jgi:hypothetical protein
MSPAGRTWGVNNKAGSLSNPETGGTESGTRRENTRDKQRIHQENEARKDKKKKKKKKNPKVANTNQSAPGTDEQERKSERFSNNA